MDHIFSFVNLMMAKEEKSVSQNFSGFFLWEPWMHVQNDMANTPIAIETFSTLTQQWVSANSFGSILWEPWMSRKKDFTAVRLKVFVILLDQSGGRSTDIAIHRNLKTLLFQVFQMAKGISERESKSRNVDIVNFIFCALRRLPPRMIHRPLARPLTQIFRFPWYI